MAHCATLPCFRPDPQAGVFDTMLLESALGALKAVPQKRGSCVPGLCRCIGTVVFHSLFITKGMGSIGVSPDLDAFVVLGRGSAQPFYILAWHPLVLTGLVIERRTEQIFDWGFRLHDSAVIDGCGSKPFPLAGEPERIGPTHAVTDHAMDISFNVVARIEELTA